MLSLPKELQQILHIESTKFKAEVEGFTLGTTTIEVQTWKEKILLPPTDKFIVYKCNWY